MMISTLLAVAGCETAADRQPRTSEAPDSAPPAAPALASSPSSPAAPAPPANATPVLERGSAEPTVVVVDPGREPRQRLTYRPAGGPRDVEVVVTHSAAFLPSDQTFRYVVRWEPVKEPGTFAFSMREVALPIVSAGSTNAAEQEIFDRLKRATEEVAGHAAVIDGVRLRITQTTSLPTTPSVVRILHDVSVVLPPAPIGDGARWEVTAVHQHGNSKETQRRRYELVSSKGNELIVGQHSVQAFDEAQGTSEVTADATIAVSLSDPLPRSVDESGQHVVRFAGAALPSVEPMVTKTRLVVTAR